MNKLLRFSAAGALLLLLGVGTLVAQEVVFTAGPAVTPRSGASNGGFAWADVNGDGTQDVFIPPNNVVLNHITSFYISGVHKDGESHRKCELCRWTPGRYQWRRRS